MSRFRLAPKIWTSGKNDETIWISCEDQTLCHQIRTKEPDYSHLPIQEYEWTRTVYGNVKEEIPKDIPKPLGKRVITTTFLDANFSP